MDFIRRLITRPVVYLSVPLLLALGAGIFYNTPTTFTFHIYPNGETNAFTDSCGLRPGSEASEASVFKLDPFSTDELIGIGSIKWHLPAPGAKEKCVGDVTFMLHRGTNYFFYLAGDPVATHVSRHDVQAGSMKIGRRIEIWKKASLSLKLRDIATNGCKKRGLDWECSGLRNLRFDEQTGDCSPSAVSKYAPLFSNSFHPFELQGLSTNSHSAPGIYESDEWSFEESSRFEKQPTIICTLKSEFDLYDDPEGYRVLSTWGILRYSYAELESMGWNMVVGADEYKLFRE